MEYLYKEWYRARDKSVVDREYDARIKSASAVITDFEIHPMDSDSYFNLFYLPSNKMMLKLEKVYKNDRRLIELGERLPDAAKNDFLFSVIVDELQSTNEIEGVRSSRREIADSAKRVQEAGNSLAKIKKTRMGSMINSYFQLIQNELSLPDKVEDFRKIYDYITENEIQKTNLPDGEIFIASGAEVYDTQGKIIHRGAYSEQKIIARMSQLLAFLNGDDLPCLIKLAIAHYYFGYIHPFYDGNGRTSRFITSLYLSRDFSLYTAFSFSNGCRLAHQKYRDLFSVTNKFNAYGEMNFAIEAFLDVLLEGQRYIKENLEEKIDLLRQAYQRVEDDGRLAQDELLFSIMFIMCQSHFFEHSAVKRSDIERFVKGNANISYNKVRKATQWLEDEGYIYRVKDRPIMYQVNLDFLEA